MQYLVCPGVWYPKNLLSVSQRFFADDISCVSFSYKPLMDLVESGLSHFRSMTTSILYWFDVSVYFTFIWCIFLGSESIRVSSYYQYIRIRIRIESSQLGKIQVNLDPLYVSISIKSSQIRPPILAVYLSLSLDSRWVTEFQYN